MRIPLSRSLLLCAVALPAIAVHAQTHWTGSASTDWFTPGNWSAGIPAIGIETVIESPAASAPMMTGGQAAASGWTYVGRAGSGSLRLEPGALWSSGHVYIGDQAGASGSVVVRGNGTQWSQRINESSIRVGVHGTGSLTIEQQAIVGQDVVTLLVGQWAGSSGALVVRDPGTQLDVQNPMRIGDGGSGTVLIENGATVSAGTLLLGQFGTADGELTIVDPGSSLATSVVTIGLLGHALAVVADGGELDNGGFAGVGCQNLVGGEAADMFVSGVGSRFSNGARLHVGGCTVAAGAWDGLGDLYIEDGGQVTSISGTTIYRNITGIGINPDSVGRVRVAGSGSSWTDPGQVLVGIHGDGSLHLDAGGRAGFGQVIVATSGSSQGVITVVGSGSALEVDENLIIGGLGQGVVNLGPGGRISTGSSGIRLSNNVAGTGLLAIGAGPDDAPAAPGTLATPLIEFGAGQGRLVFNHTHAAYEPVSALTGVGTVELLAGSTGFDADSSTFQGTTQVAVGARLRGKGILGGNVMVAGELAPGDASRGRLRIDGPLALDPGAVTRIRLDAAGGHDALEVSGQIGVDGVLRIVAEPGVYTVGTLYPIVTAGGFSGQFSAIESSGPVLEWQLTTMGDTLFLEAMAADNDTIFGDGFEN